MFLHCTARATTHASLCRCAVAGFGDDAEHAVFATLHDLSKVFETHEQLEQQKAAGQQGPPFVVMQPRSRGAPACKLNHCIPLQSAAAVVAACCTPLLLCLDHTHVAASSAPGPYSLPDAAQPPCLGLPRTLTHSRSPPAADVPHVFCCTACSFPLLLLLCCCPCHTVVLQQRHRKPGKGAAPSR